MVPDMIERRAADGAATAGPDHVPSGAALLALELGSTARGVRGLDVHDRGVDRAPPRAS
jgi:hypothetical protein